MIRVQRRALTTHHRHQIRLLRVLLLSGLASWLGAAEALAWPTLSDLVPARFTPDVPPLGEPRRFLPAIERRIVLRLQERRVYLYEGDGAVASYPVAIGRAGWETPTGQFTILQTVENPIWQHPFTKEVVLPGPQNPLGSHWIGFWTDGENAIGFHGTPDEHLIGQAVSHGCVRMRNADIAALFARVEVGMSVIVER